MNVDWNRFELVLESLGVLARLTENKKLTIRTGHIDIEKYNLIQSIIRGWKGDMRTTCLESVKHIVNEAIHMARASLQEVLHPPLPGPHFRGFHHASGSYGSSGAMVEDQLFLEQQRSMRRFGRLTEALEAASKGIETQNVTYKNDEHFCAKVGVLVDSIREALEDMQISLSTTQKPASLVSNPSAAPPISNAPSVTKPSTPLFPTNSSFAPAASGRSQEEEDEMDVFG